MTIHFLIAAKLPTTMGRTQHIYRNDALDDGVIQRFWIATHMTSIFPIGTKTLTIKKIIACAEAKSRSNGILQDVKLSRFLRVNLFFINTKIFLIISHLEEYHFTLVSLRRKHLLSWLLIYFYLFLMEIGCFFIWLVDWQTYIIYTIFLFILPPGWDSNSEHQMKYHWFLSVMPPGLLEGPVLNSYINIKLFKKIELWHILMRA